jgi:DNA-binding NarL/FixJ family response regulator
LLAAAGNGVVTARIRVVLGEDSFVVREGIAAVLGRLAGIELVAACDDLDSLRETVDRTAPDVVLTDIRMPPTQTDEGIRLAAELRETHPRIGVVVLSQHAEPLYATALFANGSYRRAYLLKERLRDAAELERAIHEVAEGGALVDPRVVDRLLAARHRREHSPLRSLTPRELEILALIAEGRTNHAIGERLGITRRGVERHINGIFAKLELGDSDDVSRRVMAALVYLSGEGRLTDEPRDAA